MNEKVDALYKQWKEKTANDAELSKDLADISEDEIFSRFYRELDFGTAGLRGVLGAGTNRMNIYTVARASMGVARYVLENANGKSTSVALAYDSRNNSELFAKTAAAVYAGMGIHVYIYPELMPTPALSYAVRNLHCDAGVVVTASHNPAKYNGYKVYGSDGCQITEVAAEAILQKITQSPYFEEIPSFDCLMADGKIEYISEALKNAYISDAVACAKSDRDARNLKLVYTPLNGAGISCVTHALKQCGFEDITIVPEQEKPDGNFPTCPYPNPEIKEALELGLELMKKTGADLLLATDPDCDRVGTAVPVGSSYRLISGNEMGVLLLDYICREKLAKGTMPGEPMAVKTIVTTDMVYEVAKKYGVRIVDVLTGFKYIGEQIALLEKDGKEENYLLGFEESYGYLCSGFVRDKDGVSTSVLICEMAAHYEAQGKTLADRMNELYAEFGTFRNFVDSFAFEGSAGMDEMHRIMTSLRKDPPKEILGHKLIQINDYQLGESLSLESGEKQPIYLPKSNVMKFLYDGGLGIIARPSGTEPKLKIYYTVKADSERSAQTLCDKLSGKNGAFAAIALK